jgi:DNA-binding transcriptional MerR regulator
VAATTRGKRTRRSDAAAAGDELAAAGGLRMRDLTRETGLPRETIHFYITQGLLPPGTKTGRNTAEYGREHLLRLQRIRELQTRHFLPLRAIKALLEDERSDGALTPEQQALLARVRATLPDLSHGTRHTMTVREAVGDRLPASDVDALRDAGVIDVVGRGAAARVSAEDAEILRAWAASREAGFGTERGVPPGSLALYDTAMRRLVREEVETFWRAFADRPAAEAAAALEKVMPQIARLLVVLHDKHVRRAIAGGDGG